MDNLPPINALLTLDAVYRTGSITKAASLLGRPHSAISKQLMILQSHAGVPVFDKNALGFAFTPEGRAFAEVVSAGFSDMRSSYELLRKQFGRQAITLKLCPEMADNWARPLLEQFSKEHADIPVDLIFDASAKADLTVSWNRLIDPSPTSAEMVGLGDVHIGPIVAPQYKHDLASGTITTKTKLDWQGREEAWGAWSNLSGMALKATDTISLASVADLVSAAENGDGVALLPKFLIEDQLQTGALVAPWGFVPFYDGLILSIDAEIDEPSKNLLILLDWFADHGRLTPDGFIDAI